MEKNKHEFTIKIEGEDWEKALDNAFKKRNKNAKIDGFRPGHAPKEVFIRHYGKESLYFDAADSLMQEAYLKVLEREKVEPVVMPTADIKSIDDKGVEFSFTVITKPEVKVKKYKDLNVKMDSTKATAKEVDEEIKKLLDRYSELTTKEGKVENGNVAVIDYEGFKDGVAFAGGKGENYHLEIGSNTFIPGFEEQLIGMKTNDEKDIHVTFPEDYHEESLKGAKVVFKVKVHEIKEKITRKLDEEFFEDLAMEGVNDEKTLKEELKKTIEARKTAQAEDKFFNDMLSKIAENTEVEIPEEMIDEEVHRLIHRFEDQLKMQGLSMDLYYQFTKTTHEDLHKQFSDEARKNVLYRLILEELVKKEKIEVTLEDGEKEAEELALKYNMTKEDLLKEFGGLETVMYDLEMRRVFDKLKEYNK